MSPEVTTRVSPKTVKLISVELLVSYLIGVTSRTRPWVREIGRNPDEVA